MSGGGERLGRLVDPTFLFRFSIPLEYYSCNPLATDWQLPESTELVSLGQLADRPHFAPLRAAWNEQGLMFQIEVQGKKQLPWCRQTRLEESDGLHVWVDTRSSPGIHRATRYCHRLVFTPIGGGTRNDQPLAGPTSINRAREYPNPISPFALKTRGQLLPEGYRLWAGISREALSGYDPREYPQIGFYFAVIDRELGWHCFSLGPEYPVTEDPSLWGVLDLTKQG